MIHRYMVTASLKPYLKKETPNKLFSSEIYAFQSIKYGRRTAQKYVQDLMNQGLIKFE